MQIRGLRLPRIEIAPDVDDLLDEYLSNHLEFCDEILRSGLLHPEDVQGRREEVEIQAGLRALRAPEFFECVEFGAISFAYLLYHSRRIPETFQSLEFLNDFLAELEDGTAEMPLTLEEDPFYVGGLMLSHGRWHDSSHLPEAERWFRRSLARGPGVDYSGILLGAIGLVKHRLGHFDAASRVYERAVCQLKQDLAIELSDEPVFHDDLQTQIEIFSVQSQLAGQGTTPTAILTKYGFATYESQMQKYLCPGW